MTDQGQAQFPPTWEELQAAIVEHADAVEGLDRARKRHDTARREVVAMLHRAGLQGFSL